MTSDDVTNLQVYLGDYKLHSVSDGPLIARKVARVIYHRGFDNQTLVRKYSSRQKLLLDAYINLMF